MLSYQWMRANILLLISILFFIPIFSFSQVLEVNTCPFIHKRNNGNGQYALAPGDFRPAYPQNNPVAENVEGTPYQFVPYDPVSKTGQYSFYWISNDDIDAVPVVTRIWTTNTSGTTSLSSTKFGPPSQPDIDASKYYLVYAFYGQNLPPTGRITLEFTDPQTNFPAFRCTYDAQNNPADSPNFDCSPTIITHPTNVSICGQNQISFNVAALGAKYYQWQKSDDEISWVDIVDNADFTGATTTTLFVNNPVDYNEVYFRAKVIGDVSCDTSYSNSAILISEPGPSAQFSNSALCGLGVKSIKVDFTGNSPWNFTYTSNNIDFITINNISSNTYYFSFNATHDTSLQIISVSDAYCASNSPLGNTVLSITKNPEITPSNVSTCYGSDNFNLTYSTIGLSDLFNITSGVRAMPGFVSINNGTLSGSPIYISIPTNVPVGVYDFNISVTNSQTNCVSSLYPFTLTVNALPFVSASASDNYICAGDETTIIASPSNLVDYKWTINPLPDIISTDFSTEVIAYSNTTYIVTGTDNNGCSASDSVLVNVTDAPVLNVTPSAPSICNGDAITLAASNGNSYLWSPSSGLNATSGDIVVASPDTTTTYTVTSKNTIGCQSVGYVTVEVKTPDVSISGNDSICNGDITQLTASGANSYIWYPTTNLYVDEYATIAYTGGSDSVVYCKTDYNITYYVQGTSICGCLGVASKNIIIRETPIDLSHSMATDFYFDSYTFCGGATTSFILPIKLTEEAVSLTWAYSTTGAEGSFINFATPVSPDGATFTPYFNASLDSTNVMVSGYKNGGYTGPRYLRLLIETSTCTFIYNIKLYDVKASGAGPEVSVSNTTICSGESTTLSLGEMNNLTVQWQSSTTSGGTYTDIAGATDPFYNTGPLTASTKNFFKASIGSGGCKYTTLSVGITILTAPESNTISSSTNCTDGSTTIELTGSAVSSADYQWQISTESNSSGFSNIVGAIAQNYTLPYTIVPVTTYFRRYVSAGGCSATISDALELYSPISNNEITNEYIEYCSTAPEIIIVANTPNGGNGTYSYQWQYSDDGVNFYDIVTDGNLKDYSTSVQTETYWYRRYVSSAGCGDYSNIFKITVNDVPVITVSNDTTICSGSNINLVASGAASYSWSPSGTLSSPTGNSVIASPFSTTTYTVTGINVLGCTNNASVILTVNALPNNPSLYFNSETICIGSSIDLTEKESSLGVNKWYLAPEPDDNYLVSNPELVNNAGNYYVFANSGSCYSSSYEVFTLNVANVMSPVVADTLIEYCSPATVDLTALQTIIYNGIEYEWHIVSDSPSPLSLVSAPESVSSGTYYLYAYSTDGFCYGDASKPVVIIINSLPEVSLLDSYVSTCYPNKINLNDYNNSIGSNLYTWYSDSIPSADNIVRFSSDISTSGKYYLFATSIDGNCRSDSPKSIEVAINSKPSANISSPEVFCGDETRYIYAESDAVGADYLWQKSSNGGESWEDITETTPYSGVQSPILEISPTTSLSGMFYRYIVNSVDNCSSVSDEAILIGELVPQIISSPSSKSVIIGDTISFTASVNDESNISIQWVASYDAGVTFIPLENNEIYSGVNSTTLIVKGAFDGIEKIIYLIEASNSCDLVRSEPAMLILSDPLAVTWLSFSAENKNENALLKWSTASETNSDLFIVYRSNNCYDWQEVSRVKSSGNSTTVKNYEHIDYEAFEGVNYYQLAEKDYDGSLDYSNIVSVFISKNNDNVLIYPNPVVDGKLTIKTIQNIHVMIFNEAGQLVKSLIAQPENQHIDISHLSKGIYTIRYGNESMILINK